MIAKESTDLTQQQISEREKIKQRWPQVYAQQQRFDSEVLNGTISPIIRLCWSFLCNFNCEHCCASHYMDRHIKKLTGKKEQRRTINLDDVREISHQAYEYGIYRFVLTGGEPTTWKDLFQVIEAVDPQKHLVILDSNAWLLTEDLVNRLATAGVYKMQISLDSFVEADHDAFRSKPGSYKRVMRAIEAILKTDMKLMLSTCLVKDRASTQEFDDFCKFCTERGIMLYVTYAKPVGTTKTKHLDWCENLKKDITLPRI
jgi:MoaA/NifB/PqqE/SkfB family radical SAM enzyme